MTTGAGAASAGLARRMASFVYEGLLLFGIGLIPGALGAIYIALSGQPASRQSDTVLRLVTFAIFGVYFVFFWSARGQTLPMQTWHLRLVGPDGRAPTVQRAVARLFASCLWFAPAALLSTAMGWNRWQSLGAVGVGIVTWALLSRLHPQRQFWHDALCGTQLVDAPGRHAAR